VLDQLTILAPGLLGGSVARAAHARGLAKRIVIWARRPEARRQLREQPWCQAAPDTPQEAVSGANLVVIAAPVNLIAPLAAQIAPQLAPGAIVTDVGSVKGEICREAHAALPAGTFFVGSHPMAGSEKTGWEHASATLFERRVCFVTPRDDTAASAVAVVAKFWAGLGGEVVTVAPDRHDEIVAHISHLPQALASTLCASLARQDPAWRNYAGGGLRDTTRIAASDPALWRAIMEQNRDAILRALREFQEELQTFQTALERRDYGAVQDTLERGKAYREQFRV
jgi:prephenate dehydrogenase